MFGPGRPVKNEYGRGVLETRPKGACPTAGFAGKLTTYDLVDGLVCRKAVPEVFELNEEAGSRSGRCPVAEMVVRVFS